MIETAAEFEQVINRELKRYRYKPGWSGFRVVPLWNPKTMKPSARMCLLFTPDVLDAVTHEPTTKSVQVIFNWRQYAGRENPTYDLLRNKLKWFELHELDEFLRRDGELIADN